MEWGAAGAWDEAASASVAGNGRPGNGRRPPRRYGRTRRRRTLSAGRWPPRRRGFNSTPPTLTVRWESALPVQQALLRTHDADAPSIDEGHYAITVMGLPTRLANNPQMSEKELKGHAQLKRNGKKIKPSDVRVLSRDQGLVIVYLFPRSKEITQKDHDVEFGAHMGRFEITEQFQPTEMVYNGKLEL